jgi:hypothetical protein
MGIPKIGNPFEDETDFIDRTDPADIAKQAAQQVTKVVNQQVVKPVTQQVNPDQAIVDFLYGASDTAPQATDPSGGAPDAGIEQLAQGGQPNAQQAAKMQQIMDPDQKMVSSEKAQLSPEQLEKREQHRLHIRNYYTMGNKLDDIGQLEEQIAKVRRQKEEEEQQKKQEEEEMEAQKKQEEEEKKQQLAPPSGKKTGVAPDVLKREQNKAENKTGFSG